MRDLALYYRPTCSFCAKVDAYLQSKGIDVPHKNVGESSAVLDELVSIGGKSQIPCLVIDGKALYESDDIIHWFETEYS